MSFVVGATLRSEVGSFLSDLAKARRSMSDTELATRGHLGAVSDIAKSRFNEFARSSSVAEGALGTLKANGVSSGAMLGAGVTAGVVVAAGAITKFGIDAAQSASRYGVEVGKVQRVTGLHAEQASLLASILHGTGVDVDSASTAFMKLSRNIENSPEKLAKYGVAVAHTADGNVDLVRTLQNIGDAYKSNQDPAERNAMILDTIGRNGAALIPVLAASRDRIGEIATAAARRGDILSQKDIDTSRQFAFQMREMHAATEAFSRDIGKSVLPELTKMATGLSHVMEDVDHLASSVGGLGNVFRVASGIVSGGLTEGLRTYGDTGTKAHEDVAAAALMQGDAEESVATKTDDAAKSVMDLIKARHADADAARAERDAETKVSDARGTLNELLRKGAVDTKAVGDAQWTLKQSTQSVGDAQERQRVAQQSLDDLLRKGAVNARDLASAQKELESTTRGVADASQRVADARKRMADLEKGPDATTTAEAGLRLSEAHNAEKHALVDLEKVKADGAASALDYSDAQNRVEAATFAVRRAESDLQSVLDTGKPGTAEYTRAKDDLEQATVAAADAADRQREAEQRLAEATAGDPDFENKVAAARRGVEQASQGVEQAVHAQADAEDALRKAQAGDPAFIKNVEGAKRDLADAERGVTDAKWRQFEASLSLQAAMEAERGVVEKNIASAQAALSNLMAVASVYGVSLSLGNQPSAVSVATDTGGTVARMKPQPRAAGGPTAADVPYWVGERGPELFVPDTAGTIVPNTAADAGGGGTPQGDLVLQVNGQTLARIALAELRQLKTHGERELGLA